MHDMKNLTRLKKLDANAPDVMKLFWAFDKAVFADGALTTLQKQLIAVAVALMTQYLRPTAFPRLANILNMATDASLAVLEGFA